MAQFFNIGQLVPTDDFWKGKMLNAELGKAQLAAQAKLAEQNKQVMDFITTSAKGTHRSLYDQYDEDMRSSAAQLINQSAMYGANSPQVMQAAYDLKSKDNFYKSVDDQLKKIELMQDDHLTPLGIRFKQSIIAGVPLKQAFGGGEQSIVNDPFRGVLVNPSTGLPNFSAFYVTDKTPDKSIKSLYDNYYANIELGDAGTVNGAAIKEVLKTGVRTKAGATKIAQQFGLNPANVPSIEMAAEQYLSNSKNLSDAVNLYTDDVITWMSKDPKKTYEILGPELFKEVQASFNEGTLLPADKQKQVFSKYFSETLISPAEIGTQAIYPTRTGGSGSGGKKETETGIVTNALNNMQQTNAMIAEWDKSAKTPLDAVKYLKSFYKTLGFTLGQDATKLVESGSNNAVFSRVTLSPQSVKTFSSVKFDPSSMNISILPPKTKYDLMDADLALVKQSQLSIAPVAADYAFSKSDGVAYSDYNKNTVTYSDIKKDPTLLNRSNPLFVVQGHFMIPDKSKTGGGVVLLQQGDKSDTSPDVIEAMKRLNKNGAKVYYIVNVGNSVNAAAVDELFNVGKYSKLSQQQEVQTDPNTLPGYMMGQ